MYLAAQRVVNEAGDGGISVCWYSHEGKLQTLPTSLELMTSVTSSNPGKLMLSARGVSSSNGTVYVVSFLDLVGIGDEAIDVLDCLRMLDVASMNSEVGKAEDVFWQYNNRISLHFHTLSSKILDSGSEIRDLKHAMQSIIGHNTSATQIDSTLPRTRTLVVSRTSDEWSNVYRLDVSSRRWLEDALGVRLPRQLRIAKEVDSGFQQRWSEDVQYRELIASLTALNMQALQTVGQVVVTDESTGYRLWPQWPSTENPESAPQE